MKRDFILVTLLSLILYELRGCDTCPEWATYHSCFPDIGKLEVEGEGGLWPITDRYMEIGLVGWKSETTNDIIIGGDIDFEDEIEPIQSYLDDRAINTFTIHVIKTQPIIEEEQIIIKDNKVTNNELWSLSDSENGLNLNGILNDKNGPYAHQYILSSATINIIELYPPRNHASFEATFVLKPEYEQYKDIMPDWITLKGEHRCAWESYQHCKDDQ